MLFSSIENYCLHIFRPFWYQWHYNIAQSSSMSTEGKHDSFLCCSDFKSFSECTYSFKCWNPEKSSVLICWNVIDEWLYKDFYILYQSSIDIIPNFDMRADIHAHQFNTKQFSVVLSRDTPRFKPGNDRYLVHWQKCTLLVFIVQNKKTTIEDPLNSRNLLTSLNWEWTYIFESPSTQSLL